MEDGIVHQRIPIVACPDAFAELTGQNRPVPLIDAGIVVPIMVSGIDPPRPKLRSAHEAQPVFLVFPLAGFEVRQILLADVAGAALFLGLCISKKAVEQDLLRLMTRGHSVWFAP